MRTVELGGRSMVERRDRRDRDVDPSIGEEAWEPQARLVGGSGSELDEQVAIVHPDAEDPAAGVAHVDRFGSIHREAEPLSEAREDLRAGEVERRGQRQPFDASGRPARYRRWVGCR